MTYVIPIKDVDFRKYIDFSSVFSKAKEGSQVKISQQYADVVLNTLEQQHCELLPMRVSKFIELVFHAILEYNKIEMNITFLKRIIISYYENNDEVDMGDRSASQNQYITIRRKN